MLVLLCVREAAVIVPAASSIMTQNQPMRISVILIFCIRNPDIRCAPPPE